MELLDDHEQGQRVQQWLRDNFMAIVGGIALGLAIIFGWNWYQSKQLTHKADAAMHYQQLKQAQLQQNAEQVEAHAKLLRDDFNDTAFASLGSLSAAQTHIEKNTLDEAKAALQQTIATAKTPGIADLARVRLARVELANGQFDAAQAALNGVTDASFKGIKASVLGDVLLAQAKTEEAIAAYRDALTFIDSTSPLHNMISIKLTDLSVSATTSLGE